MVISKFQNNKLLAKRGNQWIKTKHRAYWKLLEDKVARLQENLGHTESQVQGMYDYKLDPAFIENKLIDLKDRSRRNSLRVDGLKKSFTLLRDRTLSM